MLTASRKTLEVSCHLCGTPPLVRRALVPCCDFTEIAQPTQAEGGEIWLSGCAALVRRLGWLPWARCFPFAAASLELLGQGVRKYAVCGNALVGRLAAVRAGVSPLASSV